MAESGVEKKEEEVVSKVRPKGYYYYSLFADVRRINHQDSVEKVKEAVDLLVTKPKEFHHHLFVHWAYQCEASEGFEEEEYEKLPEEEKEKLYLMHTEDGEVTCVGNSFAGELLRDWEEFHDFPKTESKVSNFEELSKVLLSTNPHWLLEVYAFSVDNRDFARLKPSEEWNYQEKVVVEEILKELKEEYLA